MPHIEKLVVRRSEILAEMAKIDRMRRGGLSRQYFKTIEKGRKVTRGPYHVLQCSLNGKNCCERVPAHEVEAVESAIGGCERFRQLANEFIEITEQMTLEEEGIEGSKKKRRRWQSRMG